MAGSRSIGGVISLLIHILVRLDRSKNTIRCSFHRFYGMLHKISVHRTSPTLYNAKAKLFFCSNYVELNTAALEASFLIALVKCFEFHIMTLTENDAVFDA